MTEDHEKRVAKVWWVTAYGTIIEVRVNGRPAPFVSYPNGKASVTLTDGDFESGRIR